MEIAPLATMDSLASSPLSSIFSPLDPFSILPVELRRQIVSSLSSKCAFASMSLVCRSMTVVAQEMLFARSVIDGMETIEREKGTGSRGVEKDGRDRFDKTELVRDLRIDYTGREDDLTLPVLERLFETFPSIKSLAIVSPLRLHETRRRRASTPVELKNLRHLSVKSAAVDVGYKSLRIVLARVKNIETLDLDMDDRRTSTSRFPVRINLDHHARLSRRRDPELHTLTPFDVCDLPHLRKLSFLSPSTFDLPFWNVLSPSLLGRVRTLSISISGRDAYNSSPIVRRYIDSFVDSPFFEPFRQGLSHLSLSFDDIPWGYFEPDLAWSLDRLERLETLEVGKMPNEGYDVLVGLPRSCRVVTFTNAESPDWIGFLRFLERFEEMRPFELGRDGEFDVEGGLDEAGLHDYTNHVTHDEFQEAVRSMRSTNGSQDEVVAPSPALRRGHRLRGKTIRFYESDCKFCWEHFQSGCEEKCKALEIHLEVLERAKGRGKRNAWGR
ncbi:hypothetical protein JCM10212_006382 [Sporobolomyces blumeae]